MKGMKAKRITALLLMLVFLISGIQVNAYLTEDGREAEMIKLERIVSSTSSLVGKVETITYNLTGDTIVYDPPKEIALVVDVSGSMEWDVNGKTTRVQNDKRIQILKNAVKNFAAKWKDRNAKICIVPFAYYVAAQPELISMTDANCMDRLSRAIDALVANGGTNIGDGMRVAYHTLNNSGNPEAAKYVITLTDGEPNVYSCVSTSQKNNFFKGAGIIASNRAITNEAKGLQYCTTEIGSLILNNDRFRSFIIGFATPASLVNNLNSIGRNSGAAQLSDNNYFYYAGSQERLNQVYTDISDIIASDVPFSSALFSEVLPAGTTVDEAIRPRLAEEGFVIKDDYVDPNDPDLKVRTQISKSLSGNISLTRKYPEATTAPKDRVYQLKPYSFTINIVYTTPGKKVFEARDGKINYDDPFKNQAYTAYCKESQSVDVIQPVSGLENGHAIVMAGQVEAPATISATVLPNTHPNIAYDRAIKSWRVVEATDVGNLPAGAGEIIEIITPEPADPLNGTLQVKGLKAGRAYIEAETQGTDINGGTVKGTSVVFVVDAALNSASMNKDDELNLNDYAVKYVPITETAEVRSEYLTFSGWRLKNSSDSDFVELETTGQVKAKRSLEKNIEVLVDARYTVGTPGAPGYVNVHKTISGFIEVAQPVEGVELNNLILMAGTETGRINAVVKPDDAYNRIIKAWRLLDEDGGIVEITPLGDALNSSIEVVGKKGGVAVVEAVSAGADSEGNNIGGQATVYVLDASCPESIEVGLWSKQEFIAEGYVPTKGSIKFTYISADPESVAVEVNEENGEVTLRGYKLTDEPVLLTVTAEYYDENGQATGKIKELLCEVKVTESEIDIN